MSTPTSAVGGQIEVLATELRLPTVRSIYRKLAREITAQGGDYEAYLLALLHQEAEDRATRRVQRSIKEARFPQLKLLGEVDFSAEAMVPKAQLMALADGHFVREGRNIIAVGSSGTGKTHVATGLGVACCQRGLRVRFYSLTRSLAAAPLGEGNDAAGKTNA